jgi:hypothetical protein
MINKKELARQHVFFLKNNYSSDQIPPAGEMLDIFSLITMDCVQLLVRIYNNAAQTTTGLGSCFSS